MKNFLKDYLLGTVNTLDVVNRERKRPLQLRMSLVPREWCCLKIEIGKSRGRIGCGENNIFVEI